MDDEKLVRLLGPIYESIDKRKYKNAIKLCNNKKIHGYDIVQVLKAHCFERLGNLKEALEICYRIQRSNPIDETVLNTMNLVFKLCGYPCAITCNYEYAIQNVMHEKNEEMYIVLFGCYLRQYQFNSLQQLGMKMYRIFHESKYVYWSCLCMLLHIQYTSSSSSSTTLPLLTLSERMMEKILSNESMIPTNEEIILYLEILKQQKKYEKGIEFLIHNEQRIVCPKKKINNDNLNKVSSLPHFQGCQEMDYFLLKIDFFLILKQWKKVQEIYEEFLFLQFNQQDDWNHLKTYIHVMIQQMLIHSCTKEEKIYIYQHFNDFITKTLQKEFLENTHRIRGPFLIQVEMYQQIIQFNLCEEINLFDGWKQMILAIEKYYNYFSSKTCCFTDVKQYYHFILSSSSSSINIKVKEYLMNSLKNLFLSTRPLDSNKIIKLDENQEQLKEGQKILRQHLFALKSLRYLNAYAHYSNKELKEFIQTLFHEYQQTIWLNQQSKGGQREVQHGDDLLLLTCHFLVDLYQHTLIEEHKQEHELKDYNEGNKTISSNSSKKNHTHFQRQEILFTICIILEDGLKNSPYNYQMKILGCCIYLLMGCPSRAFELYQQLDIKQILLESSAFFILDGLMKLLDLSEAKMIYEQICYLHAANVRESNDYIMKALNMGFYSKVTEIISFNYIKMKTSQQLFMAKTELLNCFYIQNMSKGWNDFVQFLNDYSFQDHENKNKNMQPNNDHSHEQQQHIESYQHFIYQPLTQFSPSNKNKNENNIKMNQNENEIKNEEKNEKEKEKKYLENVYSCNQDRNMCMHWNHEIESMNNLKKKLKLFYPPDAFNYKKKELQCNHYDYSMDPFSLIPDASLNIEYTTYRIEWIHQLGFTLSNFFDASFNSFNEKQKLVIQLKDLFIQFKQSILSMYDPWIKEKEEQDYQYVLLLYTLVEKVLFLLIHLVQEEEEQDEEHDNSIGNAIFLELKAIFNQLQNEFNLSECFIYSLNDGNENEMEKEKTKMIMSAFGLNCLSEFLTQSGQWYLMLLTCCWKYVEKKNIKKKSNNEMKMELKYCFQTYQKILKNIEMKCNLCLQSLEHNTKNNLFHPWIALEGAKISSLVIENVHQIYQQNMEMNLHHICNLIKDKKTFLQSLKY